MKTSKQTSHFTTPVEQTWFNTIRDFIRASYTVFYVRAPIHNQVAKLLKDSLQPTHAPLTKELKAISKELKKADTSIRPRLKQKELLGLMGVLMQFTAVLPRLRPYCQTPYDHIDKLYKEVVKRGKKQPLGFSEQLAIALKQTKGDLPEALWRLLITSRLYARWYDTEAIIDLPEFSKDEIMERTAVWSLSVKATKPYGSSPDQDSAGDTYYCWTHALAKVAFHALAEKQTTLTRLEAKALEHGTLLNHKLAHKVKRQGVVSDHMVAAEYGNRIGDMCVKALKTQKQK